MSTPPTNTSNSSTKDDEESLLSSIFVMQTPSSSLPATPQQRARSAPQSLMTTPQHSVTHDPNASDPVASLAGMLAQAFVSSSNQGLSSACTPSPSAGSGVISPLQLAVALQGASQAIGTNHHDWRRQSAPTTPMNFNLNNVDLLPPSLLSPNQATSTTTDQMRWSVASLEEQLDAQLSSMSPSDGAEFLQTSFRRAVVKSSTNDSGATVANAAKSACINLTIKRFLQIESTTEPPPSFCVQLVKTTAAIFTDVKSPPLLLLATLQHVKGGEQQTMFVRSYFASAAQRARDVLGNNVLENEFMYLMRMWCHSIITNEHVLIELASVMDMEREVLFPTWTGADFERSSVFVPLFALTVIPGGRNAQPYHHFRHLCTDMMSQNETDTLHYQLCHYMQELHKMLHTVLKKLFAKKSVSNDAPFNWITAALRLNLLRTTIADRDALGAELGMLNSSDGFMLNLSAVFLLFCKPLFNTEKGAFKSIHTGYPSLSARIDYASYPKIARIDNVSVDMDMLNAMQSSSSTTTTTTTTSSSNSLTKSVDDESKSFLFITELFYIAFDVFHIALMPTLRVLEHTNQTLAEINKVRNEQRRVVPDFDQTPTGLKLKQQMLNHLEVWLTYNTMMSNEAFLHDIMGFAYMTFSWFLNLFGDVGRRDPANVSKNVPQLKAMFATFPAYFVRDLCDLVVQIAVHNTEVFATCSLPRATDFVHLTVEWAVTMLACRELVHSPVIRSKVCHVLEIFDYLARVDARRDRWKANFRDQLAYVFKSNQTATKFMIPALMEAYVSVGIVEGLDVDKEQFDKYSERYRIAQLLLSLWREPSYRVALRDTSTGAHGTFEHFIDTVLNDEYHLLDDALGRLQDIRNMQLAMSRSDEWNAQTNDVQRERERYLRVQERSAASFLRLATTVLTLLQELTQELSDAFLQERIVNKLANMLVHFLERLCGSDNKSLKVKTPEKYHFKPKLLLKTIVSVLSNVCADERFIVAVVDVYEYDEQTLSRAVHVMKREGELAPSVIDRVLQFRNVLKDRLSLHGVSTAADASNVELQNGGSLDLLADGYADEKQAKISTQALHEALSSSGVAVSSVPSTSAVESTTTPVVMDDDADLVDVIDSDLEKSYAEALSDERFDEGSFQNAKTRKWHHHYGQQADQSTSVTSKKMARIMSEFSTLAESLPLSVGSSVFVRCDEDRMDMIKALITGPADTPYSGGCFVFHVFLPQDYPSVPPLVNCETTGNGTVRFSPNIYNCGKVCLSLLGTWHGNDAASKWQENSSSLQQVLISIQGLILIEKPYFCEPAYETTRGTKEGEAHSREYNDDLRFGTLRHAIVGQLRNPDVGFEDVIRTHFRVQRKRILTQAQRWLKQCLPRNRKRMQRVVAELTAELNKL